MNSADGSRNSRALWLWACFASLLISIAFQSDVYGSEKRVAMIIGNSAYEESPLRNSANDANDVARVLVEKLGFETEVHLDLDLRQMKDATEGFRKHSENADIRLFYFAGHGLSYATSNYLLPIGAQVDTADDLYYEAYDLNRIITKMTLSGRGINILILDSCRNNSITNVLSKTNAGFFRSAGESDTYLLYASKIGYPASDGEGDNGTFTKHLLRFLSEPGLSLNEVATQVRNAVTEETASAQIPWSESGLKKAVYLAGREKEFDFLAKASNIEFVRGRLCDEQNTSKGREYKLKADTLYAGKHEYEGRPDHRASWTHFLKAIEFCDTNALLSLSTIMFNNNRCLAAIEYARLASNFGNRIANRIAQQISSHMRSGRSSKCESIDRTTKEQP